MHRGGNSFAIFSKAVIKSVRSDCVNADSSPTQIMSEEKMSAETSLNAGIGGPHTIYRTNWFLLLVLLKQV